MTLKKKIGIAASAVCTVVAVVLCVLLYREWTRPKIIEAPFEKLYWGMTLEEAEQVLEEVGIDKVVKAGLNDYGMQDTELWTLTAEQAELLGYKPINGLELSTLKNWPVHVGFESANRGGIVRLTTVSVVIEVEASEAVTSLAKVEHVRKQISKKFGLPFNDRQSSWAITDDANPVLSADPLLVMRDERAVGTKEVILEYHGNRYVAGQYGGQYNGVTADNYM